MVLLIYMADEVLSFGLEMFGFDADRQKRQLRATNIEDFKTHFGVQPVVLAQIWEDLQTTSVEAARINTATQKGMVTLETFLRAHHFLCCYPTEGEGKGQSGNTKKTWSKRVWYFLERIQALKAVKIVFLKVDEWTTVFGMSTDGVHFRFHEVKHPTLSKDPKMKTFKGKGAALAYEFGLHLWKSRLVWLKGPVKAGIPDRTIYRSALKKKIPKGKKIVVDRGYIDKADPKLAPPNSHDSKELATFKAHAKMRQEAFHSRLKRYACLKNDFRHGIDKHQTCVEAICVICQYEMELVSPMFDV